MSEKLQGVEWIVSRQKRSTDIAIASVLIPTVSPMSALGAIAFALETGVNPLFVQDRLDTKEGVFRVGKLRTMPFEYDLADSSAGYGDKRASRVGRILRKTTLDESPQLLQVLSGRMSIVGPRPLVPRDVERTLTILSPSEQADWRHVRSTMKPGLLSEFGNISRELTPQTDGYLLARVEADHRYAQMASWALDTSIVTGALRVGLAAPPSPEPKEMF